MKTTVALVHWLDRHWGWMLLVAVGLAILQGVVVDALRYTVWGGVPGIMAALLIGSVISVRAHRRSRGYLGLLAAALLLAAAVYYEVDQRPYQFSQGLLYLVTLMVLIIVLWRILREE
jgi:peptidoglycan/LPS O-acetylase OafA/YrhL